MDLGIGGPLYYEVVAYLDMYQSFIALNGTASLISNITTNDTYVNVTNLFPYTNYTMTVEAEDGVPGDEINTSTSINVTTNSTCKLIILMIH